VKLGGVISKYTRRRAHKSFDGLGTKNGESEKSEGMKERKCVEKLSANLVVHW